MSGSSPNWRLGYVPTVAEWNALWAGKLDTVALTAEQIAEPTAEILADVDAIYRLNEPPYTRYISNGTALVSTDGSGGPFLPLTGGTLTGPLNYTATGGTVVRSAQDRAADVINVKDFGAVGNGITNDEVAIQAAASAIPSTGGILYLPPAIYITNSGITLKSNTVVSAFGATIQAGSSFPSSTIPLLTNLNNTATTLTDSNITILGITLDYGAYGAASGHAINMAFVSGVKVDKCVFQCRGSGNGVAFIGTNNSSITNSECYDFVNCAWDHWGGATDARVINNFCSSLSSAGPGCSCIQFTGYHTDLSPATCAGFICTNNICYMTGEQGQIININGPTSGGSCSDFEISGNELHATNGVGVWGILTGGIASNGSIHHNRLYGNGLGFSAVGSYGPTGFNVRVEHNTAINWDAGATGIFNSTTVGGTLIGNKGYACSSPLVAAFDDTTTVYDNTTGTGIVPIYRVAIQSGSAVFDGGLSSVADVHVGWDGAGGATLFLNSAEGHGTTILYEVAGNPRWFVGANAAAESGGNAGSDYVITAASDAGSPLFFPLTITRATGAVKLANGISLWNETPPASKPVVTGSRGGNAALASLLTALASYGLITDSSS